MDEFFRRKWMGGTESKDLRLAQVFLWGKSAELGSVLTPIWGKWRGKDLNLQPRAYEAQSWLIHLSIPKTKFFAFSVGRAGVSLLDFQKRFVNKSVVVPSHRLRNPATYCRRIVRFGKQLPHHSPLVTSTI